MYWQVERWYGDLGGGPAWYQRVITWVQDADRQVHLMKLVHEELAHFFDVVNEREFREIQAPAVLLMHPKVHKNCTVMVKVFSLIFLNRHLTVEL